MAVPPLPRTPLARRGGGSEKAESQPRLAARLRAQGICWEWWRVSCSARTSAPQRSHSSRVECRRSAVSEVTLMDAINNLRGGVSAAAVPASPPRRGSVCHSGAAAAKERRRRLRAVTEAFLRPRQRRSQSPPLSACRNCEVGMLFLRPRQGHNKPRESVRCMPQTLQ